MTNTITNLCYVVNSVSLAIDNDTLAEAFVLGLKCGVALGFLAFIAKLVKAGLSVPFFHKD